MIDVDQFDLVAVLTGVMFTMRKLDAQSRRSSQYPNVAPEAFEAWQRQAVAAYSPGAFASFFRELFHFSFVWYVSHHPLPAVSFRHIGLLVDAMWIICVVTTLVLAHFARERARKLSISLERPQPTP